MLSWVTLGITEDLFPTMLMLLYHSPILLKRKPQTKPAGMRIKCNQLKKLLCSSPILSSPDFSREDGFEQPVSYYSQKLLPREQRYSTVEKDLLAIKLTTSALKVYLLG